VHALSPFLLSQQAAPSATVTKGFDNPYTHREHIRLANQDVKRLLTWSMRRYHHQGQGKRI